MSKMDLYLKGLDGLATVIGAALVVESKEEVKEEPTVIEESVEEEYLCEGIKSSSLKKGDRVMMKDKYEEIPVEILGFSHHSAKYGDHSKYDAKHDPEGKFKGKDFESHKEMLDHYGVKSLKDLEQHEDIKKAEYGHHPYMKLKAHENGNSYDFNAYPYKGRWNVGTSADSISFRKMTPEEEEKHFGSK